MSLLSGGSHGACWSSWSYNICDVTGFTFLSLSTSRSTGDALARGADGAALSEWDLGVGTVFQLLADNFVAQDGSRVAHADATRLRLPHVLVAIALAFLHAAAGLLVILFLTFDKG